MVNNYLDLGINEKDIGIITPYWSQVALLRNMLEKVKVEISTVDGFQGSEKELIIVSMVRSNPKKNVGFLSEIRRINVTITRAKRGCVVIGDCETLSGDENIANLISHCKQKGVVWNVGEFL